MRGAQAGMQALLALALYGATPAAAQPAAVTEAWVRAPAPGQNVAAAYMEITGRTPGWLVGVSSPAAARAELHATAVENGVMKMRALERLELPLGKPVRLAPGGLHVMLFDLKQPLKPGDTVALTLTLLRQDRSARVVFTVRAPVRAGPVAPHRH